MRKLTLTVLVLCVFTWSHVLRGEEAGLPATSNWPEFRGPTGDGYAVANDLPMQWSETENVKWKTAIHGRGWSTPVVWGTQVWLTTATPDGKKMSVLCIDRQSGEVIFDQLLHENADPEPLGNNINSYASPSPTIEEGRVYIHFGSYGTTCIDTSNFKTVWQRIDLPCRHYRGPGSSPILFGDSLILTMDGIDFQYLIALDKKTGKKIWRTDRSTDFKDLDATGKPKAHGDLRKAYSTPLIRQTPSGLQMFSSGAKASFSYDPRDGREIWTVTYTGFSNASRPVYGDGMVYINTGYGRPHLIGVRTDGKGDVTDTHVKWDISRSVPKRSSPVLVDDLLFMYDDGGVVSCVDVKEGKVIWVERIRGNVSASPIYANGRIYLFNQEGQCNIIAPTRSFQELAVNQLDDGMMASPAVADNALYIRTKTHLYRIEK